MVEPSDYRDYFETATVLSVILAHACPRLVRELCSQTQVTREYQISAMSLHQAFIASRLHGVRALF